MMVILKGAALKRIEISLLETGQNTHSNCLLLIKRVPDDHPVIAFLTFDYKHVLLLFQS